MDKKIFKISLSTVLLILSIIVIVVMGVFIYKLNNDKKLAKQKISELEAQINFLNDKNNSFQNNNNNEITRPDIEINKTANENYKLEDLTYNIIVNDWSSANDGIIGGFASTYKATFVNSDKKEMYTISYSDVWEVHEDKGEKDSVLIEVRKISDKKLLNITNKAEIRNNATVKDYLNSHIKTDYNLKIVLQSIDDIKYDILVNSKTSTLKEDMTSKTADGVYAIEYYYELVNSQLMKKYRVYVHDLAEVFNNEGEYDSIIVESEKITDDELNQIRSNNHNKNIELLNLYDLIKNHINEDFEISINEY